MSFIFNATTPSALAQLSQSFSTFWTSQGSVIGLLGVNVLITTSPLFAAVINCWVWV